MKKFNKTHKRTMSLSTPEAKETVTTLRDRLKHGQNMTKILESQLDTAQQNISLLQGQVRLANETILNLKKYFQETENTINELLLPNHQTSRKFHFENAHKENEDVPSSKNSVNSEIHSRSPRSPESSDSKNQEEKRESHNKSPYAQQLRQVLDVLQDEEPRKSSSIHHNDKDCHCSDCQIHVSRSSSTKSYHEGEHYQRKVSSESDYCKVKHKVNGHSDCHEQISPKSPYYRRSSESNPHHGSYGSHCMGPCCQNDSPGGYKMIEKSSHYIESEKSSHYLEKSPPGVHYIAVHSPDRDVKHADRHHGHHINYVPYAYHMAENPHKAMHEVVPPMSPTGRRKRAYMPILPNEEPPHLKYTKVKRIDGSKLTAQKVLQDFTKRRFIAYNPRYDLDLLIVPPPVPASDLMKTGVKGLRSAAPLEAHNKSESSNKHSGFAENVRPQMYPDSDSISPRDSHDDVFTEPQQLNDTSDSNNNNSTHEDNNNNNKNNKVPWVPKQSMFSSKGVDVLPSIKEEPRSKLEDQISKLRNEQAAPVKIHPSYHQKSNSPYNDSNNNIDSPNSILIHDRESSSPVSLVNRRTEQYCN